MKLVVFNDKKGREIFINPNKVTSVKTYGGKGTLITLDSGVGAIQIVDEDLRSVVSKLQS